MKLRSLIVSSLIGLSLAACNAGSTLPASSSSTPATSVTQTVSGAQGGTTQALSAVGGVTPSITLPTTLTVPFSGTVTSSSTQPSTVSTFSVAGPVAQSARSAESTVPNSTAVLFVAITPTTTTTASGTVSLSATLASTPTSGVTYHVAFFDGSVWQTGYTTAGTVSGNTVSFSSIALPSTGVTLTAGTTYAAVLYTVPGVEGTVSAGSSYSGTLLDGTTASLTIPTVSGASTGVYTAFGSTSSISGSPVLPTSGTFVGGVSVVPAGGFTTSGTTSLSYTLTPASASVGKTLTLYYVTSSAATPVASKVLSSSVTGTLTGTISVPSGTSVSAGGSYTFVAYEQ